MFIPSPMLYKLSPTLRISLDIYTLNTHVNEVHLDFLICNLFYGQTNIKENRKKKNRTHEVKNTTKIG